MTDLPPRPPHRADIPPRPESRYSPTSAWLLVLFAAAAVLLIIAITMDRSSGVMDAPTTPGATDSAIDPTETAPAVPAATRLEIGAMKLLRAFLACLALAGLASAQEGEEKKDDLPEVAQACDALDKAYKDKDDDGAKSNMRALVDRMPQAGPKDQKKMLAARGELGRIWKRLMGRHYPAMSMIFVSDLLDSPGKIELEATAIIPQER